MSATPTALVCREVFDENSQPSVEEISEYAQQIGIDPVTESHLLPLARDGLMQALPPPWKAYYDDKLKTHYFYNSETRVTQWDHPLDQVYKNLVIKAKLSSERGDSILDDTCVSIQDLVTYEEDAHQIPSDKAEKKDKMEMQDSSIESSLEEEMGNDHRKSKITSDLFQSQNISDLSKSALLAPIGRKPLPPVGGFDKKLSDIKGLVKRPGDSNTFPRTAQTTVSKFKSGMYQQRDNDSLENSDSEHYGRKNPDARWSTPAFGQGNRITKHTPEIIDLSFNPTGSRDSPLRDTSANTDKPKKGLTLSGGGSIFLKSNRNAQTENWEGNNSKSGSSENPKGILRERSFGETGYRAAPPPAEGSKQEHTVSEEDRKSVRFNLEQKEVDFQYDYSPSPSSNSSSDMLQGREGSVIAVDRAVGAAGPPPPWGEPPRHASAGPLTMVRRNSDISGLSTQPASVNMRKLRPLKSDDNIKVNIQPPAIGLTKTPELGSSDEPKISVGNSPSRKLVKPLPSDFIKPSLFQKPFEKLSDILKPTSPDSDSESDFIGVTNNKSPTSKNKLSINLMESVESEASMESPDKESFNLETNSSIEPQKVPVKALNEENKKRNKDLVSKRVDSIELRRNSLNKMPAFNEYDSDRLAKDIKKYDTELANMKEREMKEMKVRMETELQEIRSQIEDEHQKEISSLKVQLEHDRARNKAELEKAIQESRDNHNKHMKQALTELAEECDQGKEKTLEEERTRLAEELAQQVELLNKEQTDNVERLKQENKANLQKLHNTMEHENIKAINELRLQHIDNLEAEKIRLSAENKSALDKMKSEHESACDELKKDYRSEVELVRSQQAAHLSALRERMRRERERPSSVVSPPPSGGPLSPRDELAFERLRCDKRLLEDKYRCLKEKYARLKNDVKISIERRNKRREQSLATGSETDKSHSHKTVPPADKAADGNEISKHDPRKRILSNNNNPINGVANNNETVIVHSKPPLPDNNNANIIQISHHKDVNLSLSDSTPHHQSAVNNHLLNVVGRNESRISPDHSRGKSPNIRDKSPLGKVVMRRDKSYGHGDDSSIGMNDISLSQSDSHTVSHSKHAKKVHLVENHKERYRDGDGRGKGACRKTIKSAQEYIETTVTDYQDSSDTGLSDHVHARESLIGRNRKKLFTRLKSASTSRLNYTVASKLNERACSPLENLRQQLHKLEELEEQFPDVTLNADTTAYRLRYPFPDSGGGGELGFLRHRALVEREGVRRARAALRRRSDTLRQRRRSPQPWQDECELTDMEVSLHRTKSILGEKVIRLRHIEKTLRRLQGKEPPPNTDTTSAKPRDENKDTTLSDISSHSSGFSSTEAHSDGQRGVGRSAEHDAQIISSLQTLNTEIRDIWQVLNAQQQMNVAKVFPIGQLLYTDVGWQLPIAASNIPRVQNLPSSVCVSVPALGMPGEGGTQGFRQPSRAQINGPPVMQTSAPGGVATSLVERTRDLRDWLKQQAAL